MERSEVDIDGIIERERGARRALIQLRQMMLEAWNTDPTKIPPERLHWRVLHALEIAETSLEWGLAMSKTLKSVAGRDLETPDDTTSADWWRL